MLSYFNYNVIFKKIFLTTYVLTISLNRHYFLPNCMFSKISSAILSYLKVVTTEAISEQSYNYSIQ